MSQDECLKRLEDLQIENRQLTEKLSELLESVARLRAAKAISRSRASQRSELQTRLN
jgi:hypothetical protein